MNTQLEPTQEPALPLPVSVRLIQEAKARHVAELELLRSMAGIIDKVPESIASKCSIYRDSLDFNNLLRDEALAVITALGAGKWTKEVNLPATRIVRRKLVCSGSEP